MNTYDTIIGAYNAISYQLKLIKMRAKLANLNTCTLFKPRRRQTVLVLLYFHIIYLSVSLITFVYLLHTSQYCQRNIDYAANKNV